MVSLFRSGCTECPPTSVGDLFCQIVAVLFGMLLLFVWTVGDAGPYKVSLVLGRVQNQSLPQRGRGAEKAFGVFKVDEETKVCTY